MVNGCGVDQIFKYDHYFTHCWPLFKQKHLYYYNIDMKCWQNKICCLARTTEDLHETGWLSLFPSFEIMAIILVGRNDILDSKDIYIEPFAQKFIEFWRLSFHTWQTVLQCIILCAELWFAVELLASWEMVHNISDFCPPDPGHASLSLQKIPNATVGFGFLNLQISILKAKLHLN